MNGHALSETTPKLFRSSNNERRLCVGRTRRLDAGAGHIAAAPPLHLPNCLHEHRITSHASRSSASTGYSRRPREGAFDPGESGDSTDECGADTLYRDCIRSQRAFARHATRPARRFARQNVRSVDARRRSRGPHDCLYRHEAIDYNGTMFFHVARNPTSSNLRVIGIWRP